MDNSDSVQALSLCTRPEAPFLELNMSVVLFAMGGYGTFLGWYMRMNPKEKMELAPGPALGAVQHQYTGA
jgi:hypothetical protein